MRETDRSRRVARKSRVRGRRDRGGGARAARSAATETELRAAIDAATSRADGFEAALAEKSAEGAFYTLVPIRRRLRGERRS
jgi:hypothetical protein